MRHYKAEVLAFKGIKETYLIVADTIGGAEDKALELLKVRHPKAEIIHMDVEHMKIDGIIY